MSLYIIDTSLSVIEDLQWLLGSGTPTTGSIFGASSSRFSQTAKDQRSAAPGDNWTGAAAEKYSTQNQLQVVREEIMADVDYITGTLVSKQAEAVQNARDRLASAKSFLGTMRSVAKVLNDIPLIGGGLADAFELLVCPPTMTMVTATMSYLAYQTAENAASLIATIAQLAELVTELVYYEVKQFIEDIESDISFVVTELELALETAWAEISNFFSGIENAVEDVVSDIGSELRNLYYDVESEVENLMGWGNGAGFGASAFTALPSSLGSLTSLTSLPSMSQVGATAATGASSLPHLADMARLPNPIQSAHLASSTTLSNLGQNVSQMRALSSEVRPISNLGQTGSLGQAAEHAPTLGSPAHADAQAAQQGGMPGGAPMHRAAAHDESRRGAASGAPAEAERAPVNATKEVPETPKKATIVVKASAPKS
ncbi:hypothetical protein MHAE_13535 [Mycobacterium haemophilum DSM 44634]|uniref:EspA/EspE family type VII secretion system effector n=1 Tax=Mycobacterium haemophilum TaxID=29311 RepID=UPI000654DD6D|nr:EspA/EspE family type VII secretion system effector [Mycobacterium haemophilum]AKN18048.1 hypothetical protein B586_18080 [Mycobacterium haemophilum DSM 44634]MCV7342424.1 hypothetical protein [Mycobacterium haemophilum DSM 44634]